MTRKKAIEIVVANVKMGWPTKRWKECFVAKGAQVQFCIDWIGGMKIEAPMKSKAYAGWYIPRKWLEKKGYL